MQPIDWTNPAAQISAHFTVKDALYLNTWGRLAVASDYPSKDAWDTVLANVVKTAGWMESVRAIIERPILVKSWVRPPAYNVAIGGARLSQHMHGNAVDWWTDVNGDGDKDGQDCDQLKAQLMGQLVRLGLRMEDNGIGARWVHLDDKPTTGRRFFKP